MKVTTVGIDLAKNLFQLHGVNEYGKVVFKKQLRRDQMAEFFVNLPACLIGMEAGFVAIVGPRRKELRGRPVDQTARL